MIRVLHFASLINRDDIIDVVLRRLDRTRFEPHALLGRPLPAGPEWSGGAAYPVRVTKDPVDRRHLASVVAELVREIRRLRPQVLHVHHYYENVAAALAVKIAAVPAYVIGRHYSDHIYYLTTGLKRRALIAVEQICNRTAAGIAVPTQGVADLLTGRQGVHPGKVRVVRFGVEFRKYDLTPISETERLRQEYGLDGTCTLVACGRMNPEKGFSDLLRAFVGIQREAPNTRLVLVGDGPELQNLRLLAHELNLQDTVRFTGWQSNPIPWLRAADIVVHPAYAESFCQVLIEALAVGTPVVMTPVGAAPEVIGQCERGRLVPKGDVTAITNAVLELVFDAKLRESLGQKGSEYVRSCYNAETSTQAYQQYYSDLLALNG
jgi:glycosyltransferase involved in cell wall biosynthesis